MKYFIFKYKETQVKFVKRGSFIVVYQLSNWRENTHFHNVKIKVLDGKFYQVHTLYEQEKEIISKAMTPHVLIDNEILSDFFFKEFLEDSENNEYAMEPYKKVRNFKELVW